MFPLSIRAHSSYSSFWLIPIYIVFPVITDLTKVTNENRWKPSYYDKFLAYHHGMIENH